MSEPTLDLRHEEQMDALFVLAEVYQTELERLGFTFPVERTPGNAMRLVTGLKRVLQPTN